MKEKKIAIVCYPGRSGLTHYSFSLCRALSKILGKNLYFVTNKYAEFIDSDLSCVTSRLFSRTRWLWFKYLQFTHYIFYYKIDIIHFESWIKYPVIDYFILLILKIRNKKIVFTAHDVLPIPTRFWHRFIFKKIYKMADSIIVHSEYCKTIIRNILGHDSKKIYVIPCGVFDIFLPEKYISHETAKRQLSIKEEYKVILYFGTINKRKGAVDFLFQFQKIIKKNKNIFLIMAGKNCYSPGYLENIVEKTRINKNILLIPKWLSTEEIQLCFAASDAVILPYQESFTSGVLKLAYAFKKPIIAFRLGELPEIINKEKTGIMVDRGLFKNDINIISNFMENSKLLSGCSINIEKAIAENYSWDKIAEQTHRIYAKHR